MFRFAATPFSAALTLAIIMVGAVAAGAILFTSGRATEVNLTTAQLVPADAGFYFAMNTDLSSEQWVATFNLLKKLGTDDPEAEMRDSAEESGVDWENDVAPFLGGNAAIYIRGIDIVNFDFSGAVILRAKNPSRVLEVLEDEAGVWDELTYSGVSYLELGIVGFAAELGDHVVIAYDQASLFEVIDVHTGKTPSLASVDSFKQLGDELSKNFLAFAYISSESMLGNFWLDDPAIRAALEESGTGEMVLRPASWVIGASKAGFEFQAASIGESGAISPMLEPRTARFAELVPGDTAMFFSTFGLAQAWEGAVEQARDEIDLAIVEGSGGEWRSLDDVLRYGGQEWGIESAEQLLDLFRGETALAFWFPGGDKDDPEFVLLAEVDESEARPILESIVQELGTGSPQARQHAGVIMTIVFDEDEEPVAYAFKDDYVVLGSVAGVEAVLSLDSEESLASADSYRKTVAAMPSSLGSFAYLDMAAVLRLTSGGVLPELDEAERALRGLILNVVDERGVVRASGVLTVGE